MTARKSRTALGIAKALAFAGHDPALGRVLPSGAAAATRALLSARSRASRLDVRWMQSPPYRALAPLVTRGALRGTFAHVALRKRFMADAVEAAIQGGTRQLVVIGGGYDVLAALVAARHEDVLALEVDRAETQLEKRRLLEPAGLLRENLRLVPADLARTPLMDALRAVPAFDPREPVIAVAEGLLMYLRPAAVDALFAQLRAFPADSRVAFSLLDAKPDGSPRVGDGGPIVRALLRLSGEPFHFALAPADVPAWLGERGFRVLEQADDETLAARLLTAKERQAHPGLDWEHVVVAARA